MKPGELRRFKDIIDPDESEDGPLAGQTFMLLVSYHSIDRKWNPRVDFLVGDRIETCWNSRWVERNSETIDDVP